MVHDPIARGHGRFVGMKTNGLLFITWRQDLQKEHIIQSLEGGNGTTLIPHPLHAHLLSGDSSGTVSDGLDLGRRLTALSSILLERWGVFALATRRRSIS